MFSLGLMLLKPPQFDDFPAQMLTSMFGRCVWGGQPSECVRLWSCLSRTVYQLIPVNSGPMGALTTKGANKCCRETDGLQSAIINYKAHLTLITWTANVNTRQAYLMKQLCCWSKTLHKTQNGFTGMGLSLSVKCLAETFPHNLQIADGKYNCKNGRTFFKKTVTTKVNPQTTCGEAHSIWSYTWICLLDIS